MFYYQTFVNHASYKGTDALTYHAAAKLPTGSLVVVPLRDRLVMALIFKETPKPRFATRSIHRVLDMPALPAESIQLLDWMSHYYSAPLGVVTRSFLPKKLSDTQQNTTPALSTQTRKPVLPTLTPEQAQVVTQIKTSGTYLLHGATGSGKTRVYIELVAKALKKGRSAIVLTPEIGLTSHVASEFYKAFGSDYIILVHSQLTDKERSESWTKILRTDKPLIIIGARSALFAPLKNIGLIVVDESHEPSYKQDQIPHYQATTVGARLAELHKSTLVLGSATPAATDYFLAQQKKRPILTMSHLAKQTTFQAPEVTTVDIKNRKLFSRSRYLSDSLLRSVENALAASEQSLLFLNRRGTARVVLCEQCGWQAVCPNCNLPLTYHGDIHLLRCHTCGYTTSANSSCPSCANPNIILKSIGTKAIVDEMTRIFPQARVQRFDTDNKKSERVEQHYEALMAGEVDILVGTQLLVKGFDLPKLSVVGIVLADTSLSFPDYTSEERSYQLLRQAIGRVGRGHRKGSVVIQSYDPENLVVTTAITGDWQAFYRHTLEERKHFLFPPYCFLLKLSCRRSSAVAAEQTAAKLVESINSLGLGVIVDGPSPSFYEKVSDKYQWQVVVKSKNRKALLEVAATLPHGWSYDIDPSNLL